jgi:hypothetical protein
MCMSERKNIKHKGMLSVGSTLRVIIAIVLASSLVVTGLIHVSFAQNQVSGNTDNNTYSNPQFGIEKIQLPEGWTRTIQQENATGATTDEVTITLRLENATSSSSSSGATNPLLSPFSLFSSPTNGNSSSSGSIGNEGNSTNAFSPTITIKLQKGDALQRQLAAEQKQKEDQQPLGNLFDQKQFCKPLASTNGNGTGSSNDNGNTTIINGHNFTVTEQECDVAPLLKLFLAFFAGFANLDSDTHSSNSSMFAGNGITGSNDTSNRTTTGIERDTTNATSVTNTTTAANTKTDAEKFITALNSLHNITTTEKKYTYTSPSSNLRIEISYSALTFISIDDFEIKAKFYQRYLPVFEDMVHSIRIQQK